MLHYDAVHNPTPAQMGIPPGSKKSQPTQKGVINQAQHLAYLESHPYVHFEEDELILVSILKKFHSIRVLFYFIFNLDKHYFIIYFGVIKIMSNTNNKKFDIGIIHSILME